MIRFRCENCGKEFSVPQTDAGKKGRCPKCKNIIVIPAVAEPKSNVSKTVSGAANVGSESSILDPNLFDIPQKNKAVDTQGDVPDQALENLRKLRAGEVEPEPPPRRKLPWIIDIFLYPANKPGLTILGIITVIPLLFKFVLIVLGIVTMAFPPMLVFLAAFAFINFAVNIVFALYIYWYFCECIRGSAAGELRAPETIGTTPGLGDLLWQMFRIIVCLAIFICPLLVYWLNTHKTDSVFWVLLIYGAFFFPMGLLAVVMFDSFSALSPILIIRSIFSTFFQYCGLVVLFYGLSVLFVIITSFLRQSWILAYISSILLAYFLFVTAHLLGRFYFKYQEKLNWEV